MWQSHVAVDSSRGSLTFVTPYVSRSEWVTQYEVKFGDRSKTFDERQLDAFGRAIGREQAAYLADVERRVWATHGIEATVTERRLPMVTLFAQTDRGVLHAVDAETGRTKWTYNVGRARYPSLAPAANDTHVATINGSTLYVFNLAEDKLAWQVRLGAGPGAGPAVTTDTVYVPLLNGMVRAYSLEDGSTIANARSIGRPMVQPYAIESSLVWPTDRGYLYVADTATNKMRFRFETNSDILGNAAYMEPERAVLTTSDGHAYAISQLNGERLWQIAVGGVVDSAPVVIGDRAYVVAGHGELSSVDGETGQVLWTARGVRKVIAANPSRVYAIGLRGDLLALDRESGTWIGSTEAGYDLIVPNPYTDRLYLVSSRGAIACYRGIGQALPLLHISIPILTADAKRDEDKANPDAESPPSSESNSDARFDVPADASDGANPFREVGDAPLGDGGLRNDPDDDAFGDDAFGDGEFGDGAFNDDPMGEDPMGEGGFGDDGGLPIDEDFPDDGDPPAEQEPPAGLDDPFAEEDPFG